MALPKGTKRIPGTYIEDIQGNKYGLLTAIQFVEIRKGRAYWLCQCECGKEVIKMAKLLKNGHTTTCGDISHHTIHGQSHTRLYSIWQDMKNRCNNPNLANFDRYGGRGIKVCDEWMKSFESFRDWALNNGYSDDLTIDRIEVDGDYEPYNCRWATKQEQGNNRSSNHFLTIDGVSKSIALWSKDTGIPQHVLYSRLRAKWPLENLFMPVFETGKKMKGGLKE